MAAGLTPFDIGSDLAGSIRIPAHFCGIYGLKPTEHRVSLHGLIPGLPPTPSVRLMSCVGPLARTVEDLALLLAIIAGPDGHDTDVPAVPLGAPPELDVRRLRIAVAATFGNLPVAAEQRAALEALAEQLRAVGALVEEVPTPTADVGEELGRAGALIGMMLGAIEPAEGGEPTTLAQYLHALHYRDQTMLAWERFFTDWDALLCPPAMRSAFPHCESGAPLAVDDHSVEYWLINAHTTLFNYTGHPAVVLPCTHDHDGMPLGVQLIGRRWDDARLLGIAQALAPLTGGFRQPPGV